MKSHPNYLRYKEKLEELQGSPLHMSFEFASSQDERVCSKCVALDGTKIDVLDAVIGVNHPPLHNKCRCVPHYSINGFRKI